MGTRRFGSSGSKWGSQDGEEHGSRDCGTKAVKILTKEARLKASEPIGYRSKKPLAHLVRKTQSRFHWVSRYIILSADSRR